MEKIEEHVEIEYVLRVENKGIEGASVRKGHTVIKVPVVFDGKDNILKPFETYKPPDEAPGYFRLAAWECGGADDEFTGWSEIVCGPHGEKLKPVRIDRRASRVKDTGLHALFVNSHLVVVATAQHRDEYEMSVTEYHLDPKTGITTVTDLWAGLIGIYTDPTGIKPENLNAKVKEFRDAIVEAMKKAKTYHADGPVYFIDQ
jgi:hypothetical protein